MVVGTAVMGKPGEHARATRSTASTPTSTDDVDRRAPGRSARRSARAFSGAPRRGWSTTCSPIRARRTSDTAAAPSCTRSRARRTTPISAPGEQTQIQHRFAYSDGFGREIQKKIAGRAGAARRRAGRSSTRAGSAAAGRSSTTRASRSGSTSRSSARRIASSSTSRAGVSPILFYDPVGRVVATLHPEPHLGEGRVRSVAAGDLGRQRHGAASPIPTNDPDVGDFFRRLADREYLPTWHAQRQSAARWAPRSRPRPRKAAVTPARRASPTSTRSADRS